MLFNDVQNVYPVLRANNMVVSYSSGSDCLRTTVMIWLCG